jgi:hypothetical protein
MIVVPPLEPPELDEPPDVPPDVPPDAVEDCCGGETSDARDVPPEIVATRGDFCPTTTTERPSCLLRTCVVFSFDPPARPTKNIAPATAMATRNATIVCLPDIVTA